MRWLSSLLAPAIGLALLGGAAACTWQGLKPEAQGAKRLYIAGDPVHVGDQQIIAAASGYLDAGFFELDIDGLRGAVAALPWVAEASVHRRWPDGIVVRVREHVPIALWGDGAVLAADGSVFRPVGPPPPGLAQLSGPEGSRTQLREALPRLAAALAPTGADIARLSLNARGSWTVTLDDGLELRLGRRAMVERTERFAEYRPRIGGKLRTAGYVDLRYADGFAVGGNREEPPADRKDSRDEKPA